MVVSPFPSIYKWLALGFQVIILSRKQNNPWNSGGFDHLVDWKFVRHKKTEAQFSVVAGPAAKPVTSIYTICSHPFGCLPCREWIHIPPGEVRKIIDSKVPFLGNMLVPWMLSFFFSKRFRESESKTLEVVATIFLKWWNSFWKMIFTPTKIMVVRKPTYKTWWLDFQGKWNTT